MRTRIPLTARWCRSADVKTTKLTSDIDSRATCDNARLVPHPDADRAESTVIGCPDCSQITSPIRRYYLADPTACPWCGGAIQAAAALDVDEGVVMQELTF